MSYIPDIATLHSQTIPEDMYMAGAKNTRLRNARAEAGLSQAQLAACVGVTRQTICCIESGSYNPTLNLCLGICKTLGKTLDELFWEE
jgi:putative transcriptional regulator